MLPNNVYEGGLKKNLTATDSSIVSPLNGNPLHLLGVSVAQASATPTLKWADSEQTIWNTFTPVSGTFYPSPCNIVGTLTVTISGTVDCTVYYGPNPA